MKIIVAILAFIFALALGAPFFGALMLAAAAWAIVFFATQKRDATVTKRRGDVLSEGGVAAGKGADDRLPDMDDPLAVRRYLAWLNARVRSLEGQVELLRSQAPAVAAAPATPASELAVSEAPVSDWSNATDASQVHGTPEPESQPARETVEPQIRAASVFLEQEETVAREAAVQEKAPPQQQEEGEVPPVLSAPEMQREPSLFSKLLSGNIVAKVGAIVLFFGVGFLLKFAYDHSILPPQARIAGVALAAVIVFFVGLRLLERRRLYGLILEGVASGLGYLTVFFALKTYGFISHTAGFGLFAALGVATTMLAVRQDAKPLAVLGLTGAFLAPILASTGQGNHVFLFSYYLLLNVFIVAVSWFKSWRALNLTGWFFTLAVSAVWGSRSYTPEMFGTVEPFLLAFFTVYLVLPVLFATRQPPELRGIVDGTLVFGTPAAVAVIQAKLVWGMPYGLASSAAVGGMIYAVLSAVAWRHRNMKLLAETYMALAVGLLTLAIAFAFGAYTTFALWTIEGAAILWVGLRQNHLLGRVFAVLVQIGGAAYFFLDYGRYIRVNPWFNDAVLGCAIITLAAFFSAVLYRRYAERITEWEKSLPAFALAWGALCWSLGGLDVIHHAVGDNALKPAIALMFFAGSALAAELWGSKLRWNALRGLTTVHALVLLGAALSQMNGQTHPLADWGWAAWPASFAVYFWCLHRQRADGFDGALEVRYAGGWIILAGLATWEGGWWLSKREYLYCMIISLFGYLAASLRYRLREFGTDRARLSTLVLLWAMFFWFVPGYLWIGQKMPGQDVVRLALLLVAISAIVYHYHGRLLEWPAMKMAARLPWIAIPLAVFVELGTRTWAYHPFGDGLWYVWLLVLALSVWCLRAEEHQMEFFATGFRHAVLLYTPLVLVTWELLWWADHSELGDMWKMAVLAVPASVAALAIIAARNSEHWPMKPQWPVYRDYLLIPVGIYLGLWAIVANARSPGSLAPLTTYIPILNPIDLAIALAAAAVVSWGRFLEDDFNRSSLWKGLAVVGFLWLNAIALRTIHYWAGVPYEFDALVNSVLVQATLSILWTSAALGLMLLSRHRMERKLWVAGAALLALVVGKLFLVDLANTGTIARIVSFLGVGIGLLVIGYVAPVPPGEKEDRVRGFL